MFTSAIKIAMATMVAVSSTAAFAGNFDIKGGGQPKLKVKSAQLGITSPDNVGCPAPAKMTGWIFTNKPGKVEYMIARKGGTVSGPFEATAVGGANGVHIASFTKEFPVHTTYQAEYRILIGEKYNKTLSNWAPLNVSC